MTTPGMQGEVSPESMKKAPAFCRREPARRETGLSPQHRDNAEQNWPKPCVGKPFKLLSESELESQKGNSGSGVVRMNLYL